MLRASRAHEDQRALGEGGVDEQGGGGEGEAEAQVVEQKKGGERPEDVGGEKEEAPEFEDARAGVRGSEEDGAEDKGADGDQQGRGDDEDGEQGGGGGEKVFNFGKVGEGSDVEAEVHELEGEEERLDDGVGDGGEVGGRGEEGVQEVGGLG